MWGGKTVYNWDLWWGAGCSQGFLAITKKLWILVYLNKSAFNDFVRVCTFNTYLPLTKGNSDWGKLLFRGLGSEILLMLLRQEVFLLQTKPKCLRIYCHYEYNLSMYKPLLFQIGWRWWPLCSLGRSWPWRSGLTSRGRWDLREFSFQKIWF